MIVTIPINRAASVGIGYFNVVATVATGIGLLMLGHRRTIVGLSLKVMGRWLVQ